MSKIAQTMIGVSSIALGIGIALGTGLTTILYNLSDDHQMEDHAHAPGTPDDHSHMHHEMAHMPVEWNDTENIPTVSLQVFKDPMAGWNVQMQTTNFRFAPENASTEPIDGEGHAHIYVDGEKLTRLYGEWYHLPDQTSGTHEISVDLNANNHSAYTINGEKITDSVTITQP